MPRDRKRAAGPILRGLVLVVIFAVIFRTIDIAATAQLLRRTAFPPVAAAVLLFVVNRFLSALKWKMLLARSGVHVSFGSLVRIIFESNLLGIAVPSGFGADLVRLLQLQRKGESLTAVTGSVLADRLLGVMALSGLAALAVPLAWPLIGNKSLLLTVLLFGIGAVVAVFFLMSDGAFRLYALVHSGLSRLAEGLFPAKGRTAALASRLLTAGERVHTSFGAIRNDLGTFGAVVAVNVTVQVFRVGQVHFLFRALGASPPLSVELAFVPVILLLILIPISPYMGLGVKEAAFIYFFSQAGISNEIAFSVSILSHLVVIAGLIPGVFYFFAGHRERPGNSRDGAP